MVWDSALNTKITLSKPLWFNYLSFTTLLQSGLWEIILRAMHTVFFLYSLKTSNKHKKHNLIFTCLHFPIFQSLNGKWFMKKSCFLTYFTLWTFYTVVLSLISGWHIDSTRIAFLQDDVLLELLRLFNKRELSRKDDRMLNSETSFPVYLFTHYLPPRNCFDNSYL